MKSIKNVYTLTEQIKDNIKAFGHFEAAKIARKKIPFTLFHFFAFGYLPRVTVRIVEEHDFQYFGQLRVLLVHREKG